MSYSNPDSRSYSFGAIDFGAATQIRAIQGPTGKDGALRSVHLSCTEQFEGTTTLPRIQVGVAGDATKYLDYAIPATLLAGEALEVINVAGVSIDDRQIPNEDTPIIITMVLGVGDAAGIADVTIGMDWAK